MAEELIEFSADVSTDGVSVRMTLPKSLVSSMQKEWQTFFCLVTERLSHPLMVGQVTTFDPLMSSQMVEAALDRTKGDTQHGNS